MTLRVGCLVLLLALVAATATAAPPVAPQQVPYQGVLLDDMGDPRTGTVDLTLREPPDADTGLK